MMCERCKHYFNLHFDYFSGEHNCCNEENCYLCIGNYGRCPDFEEGDVPEGEIRGEWESDREKRKGNDEDG